MIHGYMDTEDTWIQRILGYRVYMDNNNNNNNNIIRVDLKRNPTWNPQTAVGAQRINMQHTVRIHPS